MSYARAEKSRLAKRIAGHQLHLECLEERHLLAADLMAAPELESINPYDRDAVTVDQLAARMKAQPFVEGELLVAVETDRRGRIGPQRPLLSFLQTEDFGVDQIAGLRTIFSTDRSGDAAFTLVHLQLTDVDVLTAMRQLDQAAHVLWSSPNFIHVGDDPRELIPNDPQYGSQYHHPLEQNHLAWDITLGSSDIIIGVTDDGVSLNHVDLSANIWANAGEIPGNGIDDDGNGFIDDVNGWNFLNNNNNPDAFGSNTHGTHVAGIAAARTNNGVGVAGIAGDSTIMPLKWYDGGTWTAAIIANTFTYAANNGAKIVNTSYNMDGWANDAVVHAAFQYMYDAGVLHFNSAGNNNALNPPRQVFHQTLLVASTDSADLKSSFSNYGTGVDIAAAGSNILSTTPNNTYSVFSGTSMATPNAAGVAALIWAANPTWSRDQVAAQLLATADNIDAQNPAYAGLLGTGRVNSFKGLTTNIGAPTVKSLVGIPNGGSVPASTVITNFEVQFSQIMDAATVVDASSYDLRSPGLDGIFDTADDEVFNLTVPNPYMIGTNSIRVNIVGGALGIGDYRLSIKSGGVRNAFGTALDGDGNTIPGDDYTSTFSITMNGFARIGVGGGLSKLSDSNPGVLSGATDVDQYPFFAEAGETITAIIVPNNAGVTLSAQLNNSGTASAPAAGQPVVVPLASVTSTGNQVLQVTGDGNTNYTFQIYRNVNIGGLTESAGPVAIDDSRLALGSGRFAAVGQATGTLGGVSFQHYSNASAFVDISSTGTPLNLTDDGAATITTTVGNVYFPAGSVSVGNNGAIVAAAGASVTHINASLPTSAFGTALLPFWDDIHVGNGNVYWEERMVGGINTLIVQWHDRPHYNNVGSSTFQVQLFASGPVIARFAYPDVDFGSASFDWGASATIGYQAGPGVAYQYSFNQPVLANNDVIDLLNLPPTTDMDEFSLDLSAYVGSSIDVILGSVSGQALSTFTMELVDNGGTVVATGLTTFAGSPVTNYRQGIWGHTVAAPGLYKIRISADEFATYSLVVTEDLVFDTEPNDGSTGLQSLDNVDGALGFISSGSINFTHYNNVGLFVDISTTGTPLNLTDDGATTIVSTVGNSIIPAGAISVGNNGAIASGTGLGVAVANKVLPTTDFPNGALAVFWDDIHVGSGNVYWEQRVVGGVNTLIVQWHERPRYSNIGSATFQVQVFESGPIAARYVYPDVDFGDVGYNFGASATIGAQFSSTQGATFSHDVASLANGDVIDIRTTEVDRYAITLADGESVQLRTKTPFDNVANLPPNALDPRLVVRNAAEVILDSDSNSGADGKNALIYFTAPSAGVYFVEVTNDGGFGEYVLLRTTESTIDGDFNNDGFYDCLDLELLTAAVIQGTDLSFDLSGDGQVNLLDRDAWLLEAGFANGLGGAYLVGDVDLDGNVDGIDFLIWNANKFTPALGYCVADINMDGLVDGLDFIDWNQNKFQSTVVLSSPPISDLLDAGFGPMYSSGPTTLAWEGQPTAVLPVELGTVRFRLTALDRAFASFAREVVNDQDRTAASSLVIADELAILRSA